ncbi:MAG: ABC transporter ATP-binding protein [Pseudomonadota bacterium]
MSELAVTHISCQLHGRQILQSSNYAVSSGELVVLLGPNGAGKSTLIQASLGLVRAHTGTATIDGCDVLRMPPIERARSIAYLPQARQLAWPLNVRDTVSLGRYPHTGATGVLTQTDLEFVDKALRDCDLEDFADRRVDRLSGGELARVHVARAFSTDAKIIVADEPTGSLDPKHAFAFMNLIRSFVSAGGGALIVMHDLALAQRFADRLLWMHEGRIVADGTPAETLTPDRCAQVYGVDVAIDQHSLSIQGVRP